jgi:hypothetical protein
VSRISPVRRAREELRLTLISGGVSRGSVTKCCSFCGWVERSVRGGWVGPRSATAKLNSIGLRPLTETVAATDSPSVNGWSSAKLAPRLPE